jgi:hypothetical protein
MEFRARHLDARAALAAGVRPSALSIATTTV